MSPLMAARWGHDVCYIDNRLMLFGGATSRKFDCQLYEFDGVHLEWNRILLNSDVLPPARHSHIMFAYKNGVYVYGGRGGSGTGLSDLWKYDIITSQWSAVACSTPPPARYHHKGCVWRDCLYVFGGFDGKNAFDDLWCLHLETYEWKCMVVSGNMPLPGKRYAHIACVWNDHMYVLGGLEDKRTHLDDMWALDLTTFSWSEICFDLRNGINPGARTSQTGVVYDNCWVVYGGYSETGDMHNDILEFNFRTYCWSRVVTSGTELPGLREHAACMIDDGAMVVVGGFVGAFGDAKETYDTYRIRLASYGYIKDMLTRLELQKSNIFGACSQLNEERRTGISGSGPNLTQDGEDENNTKMSEWRQFAVQYPYLLNTIQRLCKDNAELYTQIDKIGCLEKSVTRLTTENGNLKSENCKLKCVEQSVKDMCVTEATLRKDLQSECERSTLLENENIRLSKDFQLSKNDNGTLMSENESLRRELNDAHSQLYAQKSTIEQLNDQLKALNLEHTKSLESYRNQISALEIRISDSEKRYVEKYSEWEKKYGEKCSELADKDTYILSLLQQIDELKTDKLRLEGELDVVKRRNEVLTKQLDNYKQAFGAVKEVVDNTP